MKRSLFLTSVLCLFSVNLAGSIIYNDLGPGNATGGTGFYSTGSTDLGTSFVATGSGNLGTLLLYLSSQIPSVTVALYDTSAGEPGTQLESWTVSPPNWFLQLDAPPITSLFSLQKPLLASGTQYWVVVSPAIGGNVGWYISGQSNNGPWVGNSLTTLAQNSGFTGQPTVQLNTDLAPTPEPATWALLAVGCALLAKAKTVRSPPTLPPPTDIIANQQQ